MGDRSTIREFDYDEEHFWEAVRIWALANNFEIIEKDKKKKLYHKNVTINEWWLIAEHNGTRAKLEAWIGGRTHSFMKPQSSLEGMIGFAVKIPFKEALNKLLDVFEERRI